MGTAPLHSWNISPQEAIGIQKGLRRLVRQVPMKAAPKVLAGADVSLEWRGTEGFAGFALMTYPDLEDKGYALSKNSLTFPYVPGLLSFREIPLLLEAWNALSEKPDLVVMDGHGIAHPRRLGVATHLGILLGVPTIGVAKSPLVGEFAEPGPEQGSWTLVRDKGEAVGAALRTKERAKPVFVSPGHLVTLEQSIEIVMSFSRGYRIPEPTRRAHELVNKYRRGEIAT